MAVPDPLMTEMRIMAYENRPRFCKITHPVPRRNDFIEVLWCMDHLPNLPEEWCAAEVLHVSDNPEQDVLATGVILYLPGDRWDEQTHTVDFLRNKKLRRAADTSAAVPDEQNEGAPILEWRYSSERERMEGTMDPEWTPEVEMIKTTQSRANVTATGSSPSREDILALRSGHAATAVEIQKMKRVISSLSAQVYQVQHNGSINELCAGTNCVLPRLRHKLVLRAQNNPKPIHSSANRRGNANSEPNCGFHNGDGIQVGVMRAKVECSLRQFEDIACSIQASATADSVFFFPPFDQTQQPLQCSEEFRILFSTFADLSKHIGISSKSDRLEMARRCGSGPQGELLRLLGTYILTLKMTKWLR